MNRLNQKFPNNSSIQFLIEHDITLNFVLLEYLMDASEKLPPDVFLLHMEKLLASVAYFYKKYESISDRVVRVQQFHIDVDEVILKDIFGTSVQNQKIICTKGCSDCCSQLVTVSQSEAELLFQYPLDTTNLKKQYKLNTDNWTLELKEEEGKCAFLNRQNGSCIVWENRPANCRNYFVSGTNKHCSVFNRDPDLSPSLKSIYADVCISAFYSLDGGEASLSNYLYEQQL